MDSKILEATIKSLDKEFGEGSVLSGTSVSPYDDVLPTGSLGLDRALGIGGYPMGSIIEVYGAPAAGKTTLALHAIAKAQEKGELCLFVDVEHGLDPQYAEQLGVDMGEILIAQPTYAQEALTIVDKLARTGNIGLIIVDSVAALVPKEELDGDVHKDHVARQARIMSQFLRRITGFVHKTGCLVIFVNQTRQKIGMSYGNPETTAGGTALRFYAHARLEVKTVTKLKDGDDIVGNRVRVKVVKNKHSAPYKEAEFDLLFGKGIDNYAEVLDIALENGIIKQSGAWFKLGEENIAQGRHNAIGYLMNDDEAYNSIMEGILVNNDSEEAQIDDTEDLDSHGEESIPELQGTG